MGCWLLVFAAVGEVFVREVALLAEAVHSEFIGDVG